jgi:hypothetical protein
LERLDLYAFIYFPFGCAPAYCLRQVGVGLSAHMPL